MGVSPLAKALLHACWVHGLPIWPEAVCSILRCHRLLDVFSIVWRVKYVADCYRSNGQFMQCMKPQGVSSGPANKLHINSHFLLWPEHGVNSMLAVLPAAGTVEVNAQSLRLKICT